MTHIDFHYLDTPDKLLYACRLLRKAVSKVPRAIVTGHDEQLAQLDAMLWHFSATDFIGHYWVQQPSSTPSTQASVMECARVWLAASPEQCAPCSVLINLANSPVSAPEQYERLIELVAGDDAANTEAQKRIQHYEQLGYAVTQHKIKTQN